MKRHKGTVRRSQVGSNGGISLGASLTEPRTQVEHALLSTLEPQAILVHASDATDVTAVLHPVFKLSRKYSRAAPRKTIETPVPSGRVTMFQY